MARILKFPGGQEAPKANPVPAEPAPAAIQPPMGKKIGERLLRGVWIGVVLVWPVLKWVVSIDVFIQMILMFARWDTPGSYAGWTFLAHFAVLTGLTYFVGVYRPKGL
ncbi:MAG: protein kleE [Pseudomonadaceae bacterium]|nr:protein kleE [Pseudomonadaceae bacterium]